VSTQEKYVAAAYLVVFLVVLLYVVIMAAKVSRLGSAVAELTELARAKRAGDQPAKSAPKQVKVG
jgi:flagellar biosynthesis/type III secretory pathway M-ring protein FliF/YscJ